MANPEHLAILKQGVKVWNEWRKKNGQIVPDLSETDFAPLRPKYILRTDLRNYNFEKAYLAKATLREADLHGASLFGAILDEADLYHSDMFHVNLRSASLWRANLSKVFGLGANFFEANLVQAKLVDAVLSGASLASANLTMADLRGADLSHVILDRTDFRDANLSNCQIYGISSWGTKLSGAIQSSLIITRSDEPTITVDNLEVAQFIYLLLNNEKIRDVINTITTKVVLILGRFTDERKKVLDAIHEELRRQNYVPVTFDFDKPATRDTQETVTTLARLARFVIADMTDPKSIPQELVSIVETMPSLPVQPLLKVGYEPWGMYDHIRKYASVLPILNYDQIDDLTKSLPEKVIAPSEAKAIELQKQ